MRCGGAGAHRTARAAISARARRKKIVVTGRLTWSAGERDGERLSALERAAFGDQSWGEESVRGSFDAPGVRVLLTGQSQMSPDGFAIWRAAAGEAELLSIGVDPGARRRGVGAFLLRAVLKAAGEAGAQTVFLEVAAGNIGARTLYDRLGFSQSGRRKAYYRNGADALIMRKRL